MENFKWKDKTLDEKVETLQSNMKSTGFIFAFIIPLFTITMAYNHSQIVNLKVENCAMRGAILEIETQYDDKLGCVTVQKTVEEKTVLEPVKLPSED